jgi:hypothetical protein
MDPELQPLPETPTPARQLFPPPSVAQTKRLSQADETIDRQQAQIAALQAQMTALQEMMALLPAKIAGQLEQGDKPGPKPSNRPPTDLRPPTSDPASDSDRPLTSDSASATDSASDSDLDQTDCLSTELLAQFVLQAMDPAQHFTSGGRHTTTATLLEAWHHKLNPGAREALQAAIHQPGPIARRGLAAFKSEIKAATAANKATISAVTVTALTRDSDHSRALHTENLLAIACGCADMKQMKTVNKQVKGKGTYDMDLIPAGSANSTPSFKKFCPSYQRAALWWEALGDLMDSYWGSPGAHTDDDLRAETAWKSAAIPSDPRGTFEQGDDSAATLVAREAQNYRAREIASRGMTFCTGTERTRNLPTTADYELVTLFLNHLQAEGMDLHRLSWGNLTAELIKTERTMLERQKTENMLDLGPRTTYLSAARPAFKPRLEVIKKPPPTQPQTEPGPEAEPVKTTDDCWSYQFMGECEHGEGCVRLHEGEPGSKKHLLATPDGICKRFLRGVCDRGEQCRFLHKNENPLRKRVVPDAPRMFTMLKRAADYAEPEVVLPPSQAKE